MPDRKKKQANKLEAEYKQLRLTLEEVHSPFRRFVIGIISGIGSTLGAIIVAAILVSFLVSFFRGTPVEEFFKQTGVAPATEIQQK